MAIRNQLIRPQMLPELISKAPILYNELSSGIKTNLNLEQAIKLAWLAQQIPEENIKKGVIAPPDRCCSPSRPKATTCSSPSRIRSASCATRSSSAPSKPAPPHSACHRLSWYRLKRRALTVLNGTSETGLAARTTEYLQSQGIQVANTGNADQLYASTTVIDHTGKPYTLKFLVDTDEDHAQQHLHPLRSRQSG